MLKLIFKALYQPAFEILLNGTKALLETTAGIFSKMLRLQIIATAVVAIIALVLSGLSSAISALAGGTTVIIGAFIAAKIAQKNKKDATAVLINLLKAEAVKVLVIVILLLITLNQRVVQEPGWMLIKAMDKPISIIKESYRLMRY